MQSSPSAFPPRRPHQDYLVDRRIFASSPSSETSPPSKARLERCCALVQLLAVAALLSLSAAPFVQRVALHHPRSTPLSLFDSVFTPRANASHRTGRRDRRAPVWNARGAPAASAHIVTLSFNNASPAERATLSHNCALLRGSGTRFEIHTDDPSQPLCAHCNCQLFAPVDCKCHDASRSDCALCEKLVFLTRTLRRKRAFIFIDSDVVLARRDYGALLTRRGADFDFVASYGFNDPARVRHRSMFNSGVMFMRWLPGLDYARMHALMRERRTNNDQNVVSMFVHKHYRRWDSLSMRWHCRYLHRAEHDIPPRECFAFHGRGRALRGFLGKLNRTLLSADTASEAEARAWDRFSSSRTDGSS